MLSILLAFVVAATGVASGTGAGITRIAAADLSSDIPGLELPGPIVAGRLGGTIYDVVYRLQVAAGQVIVANLSGAPGTDFDLYLFDGTATTVLSEVGQLVKSTGPTSSESISWPSRPGGTYYIDLNGATDVEGDFRLTVQTIPDPTPPTVSLVLAGGRPSTNELAVPVTLTGTEDLSGLAEMAFSTDGVAFGPWLPFQASSTWTFGPGEGPRTLWAKARNGVGVESAMAADSVVIDTTPPSVIALEPAPGATVATLRPVFRVTFNEPIAQASWADLGLVVQSASGSLVAGSYSYDASKRVGTFVPSSDMQAGATYVVTIGLVRDVAGNAVAPLASWAVTPVAPTALLASANPAILPLAGSTSLTVQLTGAPANSTVDLQVSEAGGPFTPQQGYELPAGRLSISVAPRVNTTYRFRYGGAFGVAAAEGDARVIVRQSVALVGRSATATASGRVGSIIQVTAAVTPARAGLSVSFRLYRFDSRKRSWVYAGSHGKKTDANGRAVYSWTPTAAGSWYWRATVASTPEFANNITPVYRWSIGR